MGEYICSSVADRDSITTDGKKVSYQPLAESELLFIIRIQYVRKHSPSLYLTKGLYAEH